MLLAVALLASAAGGAQTREPIIDMHLHATSASSQGPPPVGICTPIMPMPRWDPRVPFGQEFGALIKKPPCADPVWSPATDLDLMNETIAVVRRLNIYGVLSGDAMRVDRWMEAEPARFMPGIVFDVGRGNAPGIDALRQRHAQKKLAVIGEVANQYSGIVPDDPLMAPYWRLAEELDVPVGYHLGTPPPGVAYLFAPQARARMHSALLLEEVLVRHRKLRLYAMHAGYPMLDDLLAMLYAHPQLYVDVGVIVYTQPRPAFYRYLQGIVDAGFGDRVMFGSDQMVWPGAIERSIAVINEAPFLSAAQKRDILYNNAARFLRLSPEEINRHHGR
jgi:predicted TIM-barrel fold metal-dependent hydrolase